MDSKTADPIALAAEIVAAFVARNSVPPSELSLLIHSVHAALAGIASGAVAADAAQLVELAPAVPIRKSITPDYLICLDDGRKFKSLRRHLRRLGMTPEEYRAKWQLQGDYPMVAANYSAARSALAKNAGLGQSRKTRGLAKNDAIAKSKSPDARKKGQPAK
jgi:predicted transcriptional regulator